MLRLCSALVLLSVLAGTCFASRSDQEINFKDDHLRGASSLASTSSVVLRQHPQQQHQETNIEYAVDYEENESSFYSEESGSSDSQAMTYSTYYPHSHSSKPCHHRHYPTISTVQDAVAAAAAAADAVDADVLVSAASHAWQRAKQLIARLAAADAAATAELITELETTLQQMDQAQLAADTVIDHRWEQFDGSSSSLVQEILANYIDPALQFVSGSDYDLQEHPATQQQQEQEDIMIVDDGVNGDFPYDQEHFDSMEFFTTKPARLPADPAPGSAHAPGFLAGNPDEDDIGLLILPEDNAANNLVLFGVRSPEEVAAVGAAAAPGAQYTVDDSSVWHSSMLEWLSAAPFQPLDTEKAAAVLIVVATLMVFAAFLINLIDLRATVQAAAAAAGAAAAAHASGANSGSSSGYIVAVPAGAMPLRTRKPIGFSSCSAVAAAAAAAGAAMGSSCGVQQQGSGLGDDASELSRPLLQDSGDEDDIEAAAVQAQPSSVLPTTLQKFYNPLHYQQLPDSE